jgi:hypothetical protein
VAIRGLSLGCVVAYTPTAHEVKAMGRGPFSARVSRVDDVDVGYASLHIDIIPHTALEDEIVLEHMADPGVVAFKARVPYDPDGKQAGSWRWPPRLSDSQRVQAIP